MTKPHLCDVDLDAVEVAKTLQRVIVREGFLKVLAKGKSGSAMIGLMSTAVSRLLSKPILETKDMPAIMKVACTELLLISEALGVMSGATLPKPLEALDGLAKSKWESAQVVSQLAQQTPFWKEAEKRAREHAVATVTLLPELKDTLSRLENGQVKYEAVPKILKRLVVWQTGLGTGVSYMLQNVEEEAVGIALWNICCFCVSAKP